MCLMQKYEKNKGTIGVDDLDRWPVGSDAFEFLSATSSIGSLEDLKEVQSAQIPLLNVFLLELNDE